MIDWDEVCKKVGIASPDEVWQAPGCDDKFPNKCPRCKGDAYIGFRGFVEHRLKEMDKTCK